LAKTLNLEQDYAYKNAGENTFYLNISNLYASSLIRIKSKIVKLHKEEPP
jgi:hypothetical protein